MADERYGGMLGMMQGNISSGYGGENPALKGLLDLLTVKGPSFSTVIGSSAVDKMLSESDPSQRFRVYRRNVGSDKNGGTRGSSSSVAHWLFVSEDGKHGFGFNQDGEEIELPESMEGYALHPAYADRSFTASGLINARLGREQSIADREQYGKKNQWMFYDSGEMPDLHAYDGPRNNCQHYIDDIIKYYRE